jgi:AraC-like DNA-binding protein
VATGQYLDGHVIGPGGAQLIDAPRRLALRRHRAVRAREATACSVVQEPRSQAIGWAEATQAARLLMANRPNDITGGGHRVGYDSPSQFSRIPLYR